MKTAKVKAQELYPDESGFDGFTFDSRNEKSHFSERQAYIKGYDTAMQDLLEKACEYLAPINYTHPHLIDLDDFKNYMQDEM